MTIYNLYAYLTIIFPYIICYFLLLRMTTVKAETLLRMDIVYFETNHRNGLIYVLTYMEVKNNKIFF